MLYSVEKNHSIGVIRGQSVHESDNVINAIMEQQLCGKPLRDTLHGLCDKIVNIVKLTDLIPALCSSHVISVKEKQIVQRELERKGNICGAEKLVDILLENDEETIENFISEVVKKHPSFKDVWENAVNQGVPVDNEWPKVLDPEFEMPVVPYSESTDDNSFYNGDQLLDSNANQNWMEKIPDYMPVCMVSLPGTNDSMSCLNTNESKSQTLSLMDQLKSGVRFLHIKYKSTNAPLCELMESNVLIVVKDFLSNNKDECVFIMLKDENDVLEGNDIDFLNRWHNMLWKMSDDIEKGLKGPIISDIRGKIVFLKDVSKIPNVVYGFKCPNEKLCCIGQTWECLEDNMLKIKMHTNLIHNGTAPLIISFACQNGQSITDLNVKLHKFIKEKVLHSSGVIVMNFPGTGLIKTISDTNIRWHKAVRHMIDQDERISSLDKISETKLRQRIEKHVSSSDIKIAIMFAGDIITRVLDRETDKMIKGLFIRLREENILNTDKKIELQKTLKEDKWDALDLLCSYLEHESTTTYDLEDFIKVLKTNRSTIAVSYYIHEIMEMCRRIRQQNSDAKAGAIDDIIQMTMNSSKGTEEFTLDFEDIIEICLKDKSGMQIDVVRRRAVVEDIREKCIQLDLRVDDEWELENLMKDIKFGLFQRRFRSWLRKKGKTIPENVELEITLTKGADQLLLKTDTSGKGEVVLSKSKTDEERKENIFDVADNNCDTVQKQEFHTEGKGDIVQSQPNSDKERTGKVEIVQSEPNTDEERKEAIDNVPDVDHDHIQKEEFHKEEDICDVVDKDSDIFQTEVQQEVCNVDSCEKELRREEIDTDMPTVLFVSDGWIFSKPLDNTVLINDMLTGLFTQQNQFVNVLCTFANDDISTDDRNDATNKKISLVDKNKLHGLNVKHIIGYAPQTYKETISIRERYFPDAELNIVNTEIVSDRSKFYPTQSEDESRTIEEEMMQTCKLAKAIFSVGHLVFDYYDAQYSSDKTLCHKHKLIWPFGGKIPMEPKRTTKKEQHLLSFGPIACKEDVTWKGLDIISEALNSICKKNKSWNSHHWTIVQDNFFARNEIMEKGPQRIRTESENVVTLKKYYAELQNANLCLLGSPKESIDMVGIDCIQLAKPVLVASTSGLGKLIESIFPNSGLVVQTSEDRTKTVTEWKKQIEKAMKDPHLMARYVHDVRQKFLLQNDVYSSYQEFLHQCDIGSVQLLIEVISIQKNDGTFCSDTTEMTSLNSELAECWASMAHITYCDKLLYPTDQDLREKTDKICRIVDLLQSDGKKVLNITKYANATSFHLHCHTVDSLQRLLEDCNLEMDSIFHILKFIFIPTRILQEHNAVMSDISMKIVDYEAYRERLQSTEKKISCAKLIDLGNEYFKQENYPATLFWYDKVVQAVMMKGRSEDFKSEEDLKMLSNMFLKRSMILLEQNQYDKAVSYVDLSLDLNPTTEGYKHRAELMKYLADKSEALRNYLDILRISPEANYPKDIILEICYLANKASEYRKMQQFCVPEAENVWQDVFTDLAESGKWEVLYNVLKNLNFRADMKVDVNITRLLELKHDWVPQLLLDLLSRGCDVNKIHHSRCIIDVLVDILQMSGASAMELFDYVVSKLNLSMITKNLQTGEDGTLLHTICSQPNVEWYQVQKALEFGTSPWLHHPKKNYLPHELVQDEDIRRKMISFLQNMYSKQVKELFHVEGKGLAHLQTSEKGTCKVIINSLKNCSQNHEELTIALVNICKFAEFHSEIDDSLHTLANSLVSNMGKIICLLNDDMRAMDEEIKPQLSIPEIFMKNLMGELTSKNNYVSLFKLLQMRIIKDIKLEFLDLAECIESLIVDCSDAQILEFVKRCHKLGSNINSNQSKPLEVALKKRLCKTAKYLVVEGETLEGEHSLELVMKITSLAIDTGEFDLLEYVLKTNQAIMNMKNHNNDTLLHHIAKQPDNWNSQYGMKLVCAYPVNPFSKNNDDKTPSQLLPKRNDPRIEYIKQAKEEYSILHHTHRKPKRRTKWLYLDYLPIKETKPKQSSEEEDLFVRNVNPVILSSMTEHQKHLLLKTVEGIINEFTLELKSSDVEHNHILEEVPQNKRAQKGLSELENLPYELQMNSHFLKHLKCIMNDCELANTFIELLQKLGKNPKAGVGKSLVLEEQVYATELTSTSSLIWRLFVGFSKKYTEIGSEKAIPDNGHLRFADQIQCMAVSEQSSLASTVKTIHDAINLGKQCRFIKHLKPLSKSATDEMPALYEIVKEGPNGTLAFPLGSFEEFSFTIQKSYPLLSQYLEKLYINIDSKIDIPFVASDYEYEIIKQNQDCAILLLGRSGTGKTTCCFRRLWEQYIEYWLNASRVGFKPVIPRVPLYDKIFHEPGCVADPPTREYDHIQQIFVTKNAILVNETEKMFNNYCGTYNYVTKERLKYEGQNLPTRLQDIPSDQYPLFLTSRQFLLMLDASLPGLAFFFDENGHKKFEVPGWTVDPHLTELTDFDQDFADEIIPSGPQEVTSEVFENKIWPRIKSKQQLKAMHPSLIWTEIMSFIKGSEKALKSDRGFLNQDDYKAIGRKQAIFMESQRDEVYDIFNEYMHILKQEGMFDVMDIVFKLHRRCTTEFLNKWCLHELYVDEAQDFTQIELSLMLYLCQNPNKVFMTGDTAQTIMKGVTFRFQELTTLFHDISLNHKPVGNNPRIGIPKVQHLVENYRSHEGILKLAAGVVCVMEHFFPKSFDSRLPRDVGSLPGPKPFVLESVSPDSLAILLRGHADSNTQVELGANQAVLVVNDFARENLPEILQAGIVLTIYEAKGLEFDDILLYNFFADSASTGDIWDVIRGSLGEIKHKIKEKDDEVANMDVINIDSSPQEKGNKKEKPPTQFDISKHKILNSDLKYLYTAITRAKKRVWIYDENEEKHNAMYQLFNEAGLVDYVKVEKGTDIPDRLFAKKSTEEEWEQQGDYFMKKKLYKTARMCFEKGKSPKKEKIAKAYLKIGDIKNSSQPQRVKKEEYLLAAEMFITAEMYEQGAKCLYNGEEYRLSAELFVKLEKFDIAAQIYRRRLHKYDVSAKYYVKAGNYHEGINMALKDKDYDTAVDTVIQYKHDIRTGKCKEDIKPEYHPLDTQTVERLGYQAAEYHYLRGNLDKMQTSLAKLSDYDTKKTFLLTRNMNSEAAMLMETEGQFMEAAWLSRKCGDLQKAIHYCQKASKCNEVEKFELSCITAILRRAVQKKSNKPDDIFFSRAESLADKFKRKSTAAEICLLRGVMEGKWEIVKNARNLYSYNCKSYWIGIIYCMQKIMDFRNDVIDDTNVKMVAHAVLLSLDVAHALFVKSKNVHHEVIRKVEDFYGVEQLKDMPNYVKINLIENPRLESMITDIHKDYPSQSDENGNIIIAASIIHKMIAKYLVQNADKMCKLVEKYIVSYLYEAIQCSAKAAGYKCTDESCKMTKKPYTNHREIIDKLLILIRLESNISKAIEQAKGSIFYKMCGLNIPTMLQQGLYEGCNILWNILFSPARHHWPRPYAYKFVQLMRSEYVKGHVNNYAAFIWENLTQQEKQSDTSVFLKLRFLFQMVNANSFEMKQRIDKVAKNFSKSMGKIDHYRYIAPKRVGLLVPNRGSCYSIMEYLLNNTRNLYVNCNPYTSVEAFLKFMNIAVGRRSHDLQPPIESMLPYWEFITILSLTFVLRFPGPFRQRQNMKIFLPASYLSLVNYFDNIFMSTQARKTMYDTLQYYIHWSLPKQWSLEKRRHHVDQVIVPEVKNKLTELMQILLGKFDASYNVLRAAAVNEDLIKSGSTERLVVLLLVVLMNVPTCGLDPKLEILIRNAIRHNYAFFQSTLSRRFADLLEQVKKTDQLNSGSYGIGKALSALLLQRDGEYLYQCYWQYDKGYGAGFVKGIYYQPSFFRDRNNPGLPTSFQTWVPVDSFEKYPSHKITRQKSIQSDPSVQSKHDDDDEKTKSIVKSIEQNEVENEYPEDKKEPSESSVDNGSGDTDSKDRDGREIESIHEPSTQSEESQHILEQTMKTRIFENPFDDTMCNICSHTFVDGNEDMIEDNAVEDTDPDEEIPWREESMEYQEFKPEEEYVKESITGHESRKKQHLSSDQHKQKMLQYDKFNDYFVTTICPITERGQDLILKLYQKGQENDESYDFDIQQLKYAIEKVTLAIEAIKTSLEWHNTQELTSAKTFLEQKCNEVKTLENKHLSNNDGKDMLGALFSEI